MIDVPLPDDIQVPQALRFLEDNGVTFTLAPKYVSASDGRAPVIKKRLSVSFSVDTVVSSSILSTVSMPRVLM